MDEIRQALEHLPDPEIDALDRVWGRVSATRALEPRRRRRRIALASVSLAAAVGLATLWQLAPPQTRSLELDAPVDPVAQQWGEHVHLDALGQGTLAGTSSDAVLNWTTGSVTVEVTPQTGTKLAVVTEEARVDVIGTLFTVRRDALGSTVGVDRGHVQIHCADGTATDLIANQNHTCLPITAAGLLGRADALIDAGRTDAIGETLDRGVAIGEGPVLGELLVRRMRHLASQGAIDAALADARTYLGSGSGREVEVQRFAGWLALEQRGCTEALPWLRDLHRSGSAQDSVLLAECLAPQAPDEARKILQLALPSLDADWSRRATRDLSVLTENR